MSRAIVMTVEDRDFLRFLGATRHLNKMEQGLQFVFPQISQLASLTEGSIPSLEVTEVPQMSLPEPRDDLLTIIKVEEIQQSLPQSANLLPVLFNECEDINTSEAHEKILEGIADMKALPPARSVDGFSFDELFWKRIKEKVKLSR